MEKFTTFYLYATWLPLIFGSFCGTLHARSVNFGTFGGVAHPSEEMYLFFHFKSVHTRI